MLVLELGVEDGRDIAIVGRTRPVGVEGRGGRGTTS